MKVKRKKIIPIIVFLLGIITATKIYFDNNFLEVSQYTVTSNKIPTSFKGFKNTTIIRFAQQELWKLQ